MGKKRARVESLLGEWARSGVVDLLRVLQILAEGSAARLERAGRLHLRSVLSSRTGSQATDPSTYVVTLGLTGLESGTLVLEFSPGVVEHLSRVESRDDSPVSPERCRRILIHLAEDLVRDALDTLAEQGVYFQAMPAVVLGPTSCCLSDPSEVAGQSVILNTQSGPVTCTLLWKEAPLGRCGPAREPGGRNRLLIVDDCALVRNIVQRGAERIGLETITAHNGAAALIAYEQAQPDLVTLDLVMPGMDGLTVLQRLRLIDPDAQVLLVSGTADDQTIQEAMAAGAAGWLSKPFSLTELEKQLRHMLSQRANRAPHPIPT